MYVIYTKKSITQTRTKMHTQWVEPPAFLLESFDFLARRERTFYPTWHRIHMQQALNQNTTQINTS